MKLKRWSPGRSKAIAPQGKTGASISFYSLPFELNDGSQTSMAAYKGKKILIVNTASDCGYTGQYAELQQLHERYPEQLAIIGFPSNDFKEQEKGTDAEIAAFCQVNYGVTFPLAKKSGVVGSHANPVFSWLSSRVKNGWNDQPPSWNFSKYLLSEAGELLGYFDPAVSPLSDEVIAAIENN